MKTLILVRHGESIWNRENRFTGWADVNLSEKGEEEARQAGQMLRRAGLHFDVAYTSVLMRAIRTLHLIEEEMGLMWVPEVHTWRLNERHYGALQGLNKSETAAKYGADQVHIWRRSFDVVPPLLKPDDLRNPVLEAKYRFIDPEVLPLGESLEMTVGRVLPFWQDYIASTLLHGNTVLIAAHGNSLRALVKYLDRLNDDEIISVEIPTGIPQIYELNDALVPVRHYYLE